MRLIQKIKIFLKKDFREKLLSLKLYPKFFHLNGIKSVYSKIIFLFLLRDRYKKFKKENYKKFFIDRKKNFKYNFLISLPRSGSTATRLMLISYFEMIYKIGNGIPKYDSINDKWQYPLSNIEHQELHNSLIYKNIAFNKDLNDFSFFLDNDEFQRRKIIFSRYPLSTSDTYDNKFSNPAIIIRNPYEQILSYCTNHGFADSKLNEDKLNIVKNAYDNYLKFLKYWKESLENKINKKEYLIIKFEEVTENPEESLKKLLVFFGYNIDNEIIKRAAEIHTKKNTLDYLKHVKIKKTRFTDINRKSLLKEDIYACLKKIDQDNNLDKFYNEFLKKLT